MIERGTVCWVDVGDPAGRVPAHRRPAVVVQSDRYNRSRIATLVVLPFASNTDLARHPGNVFVTAVASALTVDSIVNDSQPMTVPRSAVEGTGTVLPASLIDAIAAGLRRVLDL